MRRWEASAHVLAIGLEETCALLRRLVSPTDAKPVASIFVLFHRWRGLYNFVYADLQLLWG
jgi:hypothetical protein